MTFQTKNQAVSIDFTNTICCLGAPSYYFSQFVDLASGVPKLNQLEIVTTQTSVKVDFGALFI